MQENDEDAWRLIQVFLSSLRVPVVEVCHNRESGEVRCNCPSGQRNRNCRHRELALARIRLHGGRYPISFVAMPRTRLTIPTCRRRPIEGWFCDSAELKSSRRRVCEVIA